VLDIFKKIVKIPTYKTGNPDPYPMFYEKRVYQGSSGKVYPLPIIDKIFDQKEEVEYEAIFMENEYLLIMVLPSLGGRIQRALDKTNQYDFVYYNEVIKPALVGLAGPWISGGIEFNWPQHHRPSTFSKVEHKISKYEDKVSIHISETDQMYGTRCHVTYSLYKGKAYLEIQGDLYNKTDFPQTFLWWANPAVAVNDYTQSIFPPDVTAVYDHGKRDVSSFPIAKGTYYKVDYSKGIDISRYKNIPVPTSYMAYQSNYDFIGNYDYQKEAGMLHVANHHISPGKKQWTWGNGHFGQTWDKHLTDENGPYIELMTGVYTDNQPDFTWLAPKETKSFSQYFMPYKSIGEIKNANHKIAIGSQLENNKITVGVYSTEKMSNLNITVSHKDQKRVQHISDLSPIEAKFIEMEFDLISDDYEIEVFSIDGERLIHYHNKDIDEVMPEAAKKAPKPSEIKSLDELYMTAVHLEQYRHATYKPEDYYKEGLNRDPQDIRLNTGYGRLLLQRGLFNEAILHFDLAISRLFRYNERPYDAEALYYKALAKKYLNQDQEAYDLFYKASWSFPWKSQSYLQLAMIDLKKAIHQFNNNLNLDAYNCLNLSLEHLKNGIVYNQNCATSQSIMITILRLKGEIEQSTNLSKTCIKQDPLNMIYLYESYILGHVSYDTILHAINGSSKILLEIAEYYSNIGLLDVSIDALCRFKDNLNNDPLIYYYLSMYHSMLHDNDLSIQYLKIAESMNDVVCFPNTIYAMIVLEYLIGIHKDLVLATYLLGNLYYDKRVYQKAVELWEESISIDCHFEKPYRNLGIAYYNKHNDAKRAIISYQKAIEIKPNDLRLIYEYDQLRKRMNVNPKERIKDFERVKHIIEQRDDLYLEYITLLNLLERHLEALNHLSNHRFHVWEGGEGKVREQYVIANMAIARTYLVKDPKKAVDYLQNALLYPENLGEGKLIGTLDTHLHYYLGVAYETLDIELSKAHYQMGIHQSSRIEFSMFYNDQPVDSIFYQGLSLIKLGQKGKAIDTFNQLLQYSSEKEDHVMEIDYFAVSLPNYLIFDDDINLKYQHFIKYIKALGFYGLGKKEEALKIYREIIKSNQCFQGYFDFKENI
jgi:tetratricopeptide (TPR) repeat protein